jgi:hypothetical protein
VIVIDVRDDEQVEVPFAGGVLRDLLQAPTKLSIGLVWPAIDQHAPDTPADWASDQQAVTVAGGQHFEW